MLIGKQAAGGEVFINPWVLFVLTMLPAGLVLTLMSLLYHLDRPVPMQTEPVISESQIAISAAIESSFGNLEDE